MYRMDLFLMVLVMEWVHARHDYRVMVVGRILRNLQLSGFFQRFLTATPRTTRHRRKCSCGQCSFRFLTSL